MKTSAYLFSILPALIAVPAFSATTATGTASATIVAEALAMSNVQALNFGTITKADNGGSVAVGIDNQRTVSGAMDINDAFNRAAFDVNGTPGRFYTINLPASQVFSVTPPQPGSPKQQQLQVSNFIAYSVNRGSTGNLGLLNGSGIDRVYVGGTLNVPTNAEMGTYRGLVNVTISY